MDWSAYADEKKEVLKAIRDGLRVCATCDQMEKKNEVHS